VPCSKFATVCVMVLFEVVLVVVVGHVLGVEGYMVISFVLVLADRTIWSAVDVVNHAHIVVIVVIVIIHHPAPTSHAPTHASAVRSPTPSFLSLWL